MATRRTRQIILCSQNKGLKKQLGVDVTISDWQRVVKEALRRKMPMTKMLLEWIKPHLKELEKAEKKRKKE